MYNYYITCVKKHHDNLVVELFNSEVCEAILFQIIKTLISTPKMFVFSVI